VCGGAMEGAARLAALAARHGGAGLVAVAVMADAAAYRDVELGTIVLRGELGGLLADARRRVWVCGPGLGVDVARRTIPLLVKAGRQVVADADALTAFAGKPAGLAGCAVLTPHAGEFARVFGEVGAGGRLAAARAAAKLTGAVVVLKGSDTIIAAPDGRAAINENAPPWLATAGSGDVLAGLVGAELAQAQAPFEAAARAVWRHGLAAQQAGEGLVAEDLLAMLRK
jgi:hydroxyethylthiazole kinase-like uncharacterized protein yjeF